MNENVTWRAKHFGFYQNLTARITELEYPKFFVDEMEKGPFKEFRHLHLFESTNGGTLMKDVFDYTSPLGILGKLFDSIILESYMANLLIQRNRTIKEFAESDGWKAILAN